MKLHEPKHRTPTTSPSTLSFCSEFIILPLLVVMILGQLASSQQLEPVTVANRAPLTAEQVVQNLVQMNISRARALYTYQGTRTYRSEYHGFPGVRSAEMVVRVSYLSPREKELIVQSTTGSALIIDKVFKKLLEAEQEALDAEVQRRSALNEDNYRFTLVGYENDLLGARYVLKVEPRAKDKFLYYGRIWVDAKDFAVVRLEGEPAKNPSFWIKKTEIEQTYIKIGDFWLPSHNHSATAVRLGGYAELTIDYKYHEITGTSEVSGLSTSRPVPQAESANTPR